MNPTFMRIGWLAGLLLAGLLAGSRAPAADADGMALDAAIRRWEAAVDARDAATLNATMTEDVALSDGVTTVTGRDAARRALCALQGGKLVATTRELAIEGDVAWRVVRLVQVRKNGDVHARGEALEIWKRVNGEWQLHRRMAAGAAPEDLLKRPPRDQPVLDRPGQSR